MIRKNVSLTETQDKFLRERSEKIGIGESELLRRILDDYMLHESRMMATMAEWCSEKKDDKHE